MSCHPELTYATYVDGELPPDERRPLEAHLVGCRRCRELVVALREEGQALGDALHERDVARHEVPEPAAPARGLALGLAPALVAATLATAVLGWLLEEAWPATRPLVAPLDIGGIYDMAFDLFYFVRDRAPAVLNVGTAVAAMAVVSALLSFSLTVLSRRWSGPTLLALTLLLAVIGAPRDGQAHFGLHEHRDYTLPSGEVHDGTLLAHGDSVTIEGVVEGDLLAFTRRLVVRGEVRGSLIAIARDAEIDGRVTGMALVAGRSGRVGGQIGGNLYAYGGEAFDLERSAVVERDVAAAGEDVRIEGSVGRDLFAGGDEVEVRGPVARNVHAWAEALSLRDGARVGGDVDAILPRGEEVDVAAGAVIGGETGSRVRTPRHEGGFARLADPMFYAWLALHVGAAFPVGLALYALIPGLFGGHLETAGDFFRSLGLGFAAVILPPIACGLVALTLIGIPLAAIALAGWITALYGSLTIVAFLVGRSVVPPRSQAWTSFGLALLVGLVIVVVFTHLPYVGGALRVLTILAGAGLLVERLRGGRAALVMRPA